MKIRPRQLLRWLYLFRMTLAGGLFGGALLVWRSAEAETTLLATLGLLLALAMTLGSFWWTEVLKGRPGSNFLYFQSIFDTLLVTLAVHLTIQGDRSDFAPLYILVISMSALLLPLPGGVLIGGLASILYFADIMWLQHSAVVSGGLLIQIGVFSAVAVATGFLGDRLRQAGTALDVAESELRQLRLETSDILAAIDAGVLTVDGQGRLAYLNAAAGTLLGLSTRFWLGKPVLDELDRRAEGLGHAMQRTLEHRSAITWLEAEGVGPNEDRVLGVRTTVIERDGVPWVTAVIQDVTSDRQNAELKLRAERLQAVAALSASLAHEIKNPLASIRSAVEQLAHGRLEMKDRLLLEGLVLRESDRLSRLLSEFIEFSRVQVREWKQVDVGVLAGQAIALVQQHPERGDGVRFEMTAPAEPVRLDGDEDLLHRALFNLVLNGAQHAGAGGVVRVTVSRPGVEDLPAGLDVPAPVRIEVSDTGPGIEPHIAGRMFDPFFSTRKGGTGLGLAVVHRVAEAHRGAVIVDEGYGTGASFAIYLPGKAAGGIAPVANAEAGVVDDNEWEGAGEASARVN